MPLRRGAGSLAILLLLCGSLADLEAQVAVEPGQRVRVEATAGGARVTGAVVFSDSTLLQLRPQFEATVLQYSWASLKSLEVSQGVRSRSEQAGRGAGTGLLVGGGIALALLTVGLAMDIADGGCADCMITGTGIAAVVSVPIVALTTTVGLIVGVNSEREVWKRVPLPVQR